MLSESCLVYLRPGEWGEPQLSDTHYLGALWSEAIQELQKAYYIAAYQRVLQTGQPWEHDYEWASADTLRWYHQRVYPPQRRTALVIVNSLRFEQSRVKRVSQPLRPQVYRGADGLVTQCGHCWRVQNQCNPDQWDWVPDWGQYLPSQMSHTFCPVCFSHS